jgi:hypothetical protein
MLLDLLQLYILLLTVIVAINGWFILFLSIIPKNTETSGEPIRYTRRTARLKFKNQ